MHLKVSEKQDKKTLPSLKNLLYVLVLVNSVHPNMIHFCEILICVITLFELLLFENSSHIHYIFILKIFQTKLTFLSLLAIWIIDMQTNVSHVKRQKRKGWISIKKFKTSLHDNNLWLLIWLTNFSEKRKRKSNSTKESLKCRLKVVLTI